MPKEGKWYRCTDCAAMIPGKDLIDGKCPYCGSSNIERSRLDVVLAGEKKKDIKMANALMVIQPYWYEGTWVFDDVSMGLEKEPLEGRFEGELGEIMELVRLMGGGLSKLIDYLVKDIPNARSGFMLLFSSQPFAGYQVELTRVREEYGGWTYKAKDYRAEPWLPSTLFRYFDDAPESLYIKAEPRRAKYDRIRELVALRDRIEKLEQLVGKLTLENEALREERNKPNDIP